MPRSLVASLALLGSLIAPAAAQGPWRSECLAMSNATPRTAPVAFRRAAAASDEVAITYAGHSTYFTYAGDFAGFAPSHTNGHNP